jgi:hypothetical protein
VNDALPLALQLIAQNGKERVSRGLKTLELEGPTFTVYRHPWECVLLDPVRDANPFFHFFESMWILAGSNELALPQFFLNRYAEYSDDGQTLHGAYGYRLRNWPTNQPQTDFHTGYIDQLDKVVKLLIEKPDTRQAVVSIWDPVRDLGTKTKDMPCNDMVMFKMRDGRLDMTVSCRSNDAIWGAYGANAVQFSFLQQFVAARVGVYPGYYVQMSDSLHVYTDLPLWQKFLNRDWRPDSTVNPYGETWQQMEPVSMFTSPEEADAAVEDARALVEMAGRGLLRHAAMWPGPKWRSQVGKDIMRPMLGAYMNYKNDALQTAYVAAGNIQAPDWRVACQAWIERREENRA